MQNLIPMFLAVGLMVSSAQAQTVIPSQQAPEAVRAALPPGDPVDQIKTWPIEITGDGVTDYLVQVARTPGGNAFYLEFAIMVGSAGGFGVTTLPVLEGGIEQVATADGGLNLVLYRYLDGDARCCPTGRADVFLDLRAFSGG